MFGGRVGVFVIVVIFVIVMVIEVLLGVRGREVVLKRPHWRRRHIIVTVLLFVRCLLVVLLLREVEGVFWLGS